ncbi:hypothetical protein SLS62_001432 [Diatrype stigma]|uniref:DUF803 domain-containing protein n=1 Tax=Diatrype stigma TaxID=117547 RepID=A0AAN9V1Y6_9PEZI
MFVVSNILGSSIQISTLPLPVLSTLQAAGLVFNSICATLILGEPFTRWSFWGTALVTSGAALIAIFGAIPSPAHSLSELLDLLGGRGFIIWMSLQVVLVVAMATIVDLITYLTKWSKDIRFRLVRGLTYGCISGILSAHSLLFAKSAVELILRTIADGDNQFVHWQSWMLVLALVTLALTQLYYLHRGLKLVSTSVLYPLVFCVYNIIAILDGLIYFQQTSLITPLHGGLIALGTVILLSGVLALSWRLSDEQHPPALGQSTLTPGLGLVEDTEGEEEDSLIDSDAMSDEDSRVPPTYNTFAPNGERPSPGAPSRKTTNPWLERTEIWDELEDQETASLPPLSKNRSSIVSGTAATSENAPLLNNINTNTHTHRRGVSGDSTNSLATAASNADAPRKMFRRRRRSTGFPGFKARAHERRKSSISGSQDATGGFWKLKWWRDKRNVSGDAEAALGSPSSLGPEGWGAESSSSPPPIHYRDGDGGPEEASGGGGYDDDVAGAGDEPARQRDPPAARNRSGDGSGGDDAV